MTQTNWYNPQNQNFSPWKQYQNYYGQQPDPNKLSAGYNTLISQIQPQLANYDTQDFLAQQRFGFQSQNNLLNAQDLQGGIQNQLRDLAARQGGLAAEQGAQARQGEFVGRQYDLTMQGLENQRKGAHASYDTGLRSLYSDAAARGATQTQGTRSGRSDLYGQLQRNIKDIQIGQGQAQLTRERGLTDALNAKAQLDMRGKQLGIEGDELHRRLNEGLAQLGVGGKLDANDLMSALTSNDAQRRQAANEVWQSLVQGYLTNPAAFGTAAPRQVLPEYTPGRTNARVQRIF